YDLPRLLVGSMGTLGVLQQVTLRCRPRPRVARWFAVEDASALYRPAARLWSGGREAVLLEGAPSDIDGLALDPLDEPPTLPAGPQRGRISVEPARVREVGRALIALNGDVRWCAELGVGTVHVAADDAEGLTRGRAIARSHGGWMLREAGGVPDDDGYGVAL